MSKTTKELADELMIWLPKLSAGKTLEAVGSKGAYGIPNIDDLVVAIEMGYEIRIKPEPAKCKEWWITKEITGKACLWDSPSPDMISTTGRHFRVIEPLSWKEIAKHFDNNDWGKDIPGIMENLKELGMVKEEDNG